MTKSSMPADLEGLAESGLSEARRELEHTGSCAPLVLVREKDGAIQKLKLEGHLSGLMNSGRAKDFLFGWIREYVEKRGATAVLFITDSWMGIPTEKQHKFAQADPEGLKLAVEGKGMTELAEEGLVERVECLVATLQTAQEVWIIQQRYDRDQRRKHIDWGERTTMRNEQQYFQGRQKMFGDPARSEL